MCSRPTLSQQVRTTYQTTFCEMPFPQTFPVLATAYGRLVCRHFRRVPVSGNSPHDQEARKWHLARRKSDRKEFLLSPCSRRNDFMTDRFFETAAISLCSGPQVCSPPR